MWDTHAPLSQLFQAHSLDLVDFQTSFDEIFEVLWDIDTASEFNGNSGHFIDQLSFSSAIPGGLSIKNLIDHDSNRPDVIFSWVDVLFEGFWWHVEGTANIVFFFFGFVAIWNDEYNDFLAKPKSAILATPLSFIRMLASLRSLCKNLF